MCYSTIYSKWQAFRYKDPLAADKFFVCHTDLNLCCRPNCDLGFSFSDTNKIVFANNLKEVIEQGYNLCPHCLPNFQNDPKAIENKNFVIIDLNLLLSTLKAVNKKVGFIPPLLDNDDPLFFKRALKQVKNKDLRNKLISFTTDLRMSSSDKRNMQSKNDLEHLKLIDMACRHIALAAISTVFGVNLYFNTDEKDSESNELKYELKTKIDFDDKSVEDFNDGDSQSDLSSESEDVEDFGIINKGSYCIQHLRFKKKKRRGGVLGFKELAAKSQLSPWHFHRVFKSMTGITPKQYGDKCFRYLDSKKSSILQSLTCPTAVIMNVRLANPSTIFKRNSYIKHAHTSTENLSQSETSLKLTLLKMDSTDSADIYSQSSPLRSTSSHPESPSCATNIKSNTHPELDSSYSSPYATTSNIMSYSQNNIIQSSTLENNSVFSAQTSPLDLEFIKLANNSLNSDYIPEASHNHSISTARANSQISNLIDYYSTSDSPSLNFVDQHNFCTPKMLTSTFTAENVSTNSANNYISGNSTRRASNDLSYQTLAATTAAYHPDYLHLSDKIDSCYYDNNQGANDSSSSDVNILIQQLQLQSMLDKKADQRFPTLFDDESESLNWNSIDFKDLMNGYN